MDRLTFYAEFVQSSLRATCIVVVEVIIRYRPEACLAAVMIIFFLPRQRMSELAARAAPQSRADFRFQSNIGIFDYSNTKVVFESFCHYSRMPLVI